MYILEVGNMSQAVIFSALMHDRDVSQAKEFANLIKTETNKDAGGVQHGDCVTSHMCSYAGCYFNILLI